MRSALKEKAPDSVVEAPRRGRTHSRRGPNDTKRLKSLLWFAVPAFLFYGFAVLWPSLRGAFLAFTNWDGLSQDYDVIWFDNFVRIFTTESSLRALIMTIVFAVAITVLQNAIGLVLALAVNSGLKSQNFLRVLLFAPVVITPVVVAFLWKFLLTPNGPVNGLLDLVGLGGVTPSWLGEPFWAAFSIVMMVVWQKAGYSMVIYVAGLQSIPQEVEEAAAVDGAGSWQRFWSVTWPLLAPATAINVLLTLVGGLKMFTEVFVLTAGGPGGSTDTLSTLLYKSAFQFNEFGYGIALAIVLAIIVSGFSVVQQRMQAKGEY